MSSDYITHFTWNLFVCLDSIFGFIVLTHFVRHLKSIV